MCDRDCSQSALSSPVLKVSEPDIQRFTLRPPSLILRMGWMAFLAGIISLVFVSHHPLIFSSFLATAGMASVIALCQRRILEAATLLMITVFLPMLLFLIISGWRPIQAEYGLAKSDVKATTLR